MNVAKPAPDILWRMFHFATPRAAAQAIVNKDLMRRVFIL